MKKPKAPKAEPKQILCVTKKLDNPNPKFKNKVDAIVLDFDGREFVGYAENLQTEHGLRMFLMCVSDEMDMAGIEGDAKAAFFALDKHPGIPKEVLEAVRG